MAWATALVILAEWQWRLRRLVKGYVLLAFGVWARASLDDPGRGCATASDRPCGLVGLARAAEPKPYPDTSHGHPTTTQGL